MDRRPRRQGIGGRHSGPTDSGWNVRVDLVALFNKVFHRKPEQTDVGVVPQSDSREEETDGRTTRGSTDSDGRG
jgi:hypothetical protein